MWSESEKQTAGILVTGAMHAYAQRIGRSLSNRKVFFGDYHPIPDPLLRNTGYVSLPAPDRPAFLHEYLRIALDLGVEWILPLRQSELLPLSEGKALFQDYGINLLVGDSTYLSAAEFIVSPPGGVNPLIVYEGYPLLPAIEPAGNLEGLSGVFLVPDDEGPAYPCCLPS